MIKEAARVFLEDWFSEHPDTAEFFDEKGMDCLADIVEGAIEQEKDPVSADDVRVESLLGYFLAGAPSQLKSKFPASEFDATKLSDPLRADCKRVIAAALTMEQRRKDLLSDLSRSKISVSALSRATGMARSTLSSNKKLKTQLLSCLVDFMVEHATALERGTTVNPEVDDLRRRLAEANDMLRAEKISSAEKDLYEVKYRKEQSARIKAEKEIQHAIEEKRRIADKYINLRNIAAAKGIAVPEELDELEKIESAAAAYQAMTNNSNSSMVS